VGSIGSVESVGSVESLVGMGSVVGSMGSLEESAPELALPKCHFN